MRSTVDLSLDDVKEMALELYLTQRDCVRLRQANAQLAAELERAQVAAAPAAEHAGAE